MLIVQKQPKSIEAEAYRTLRTNIQYSSFDDDIKTIVITSSGPGEGKSTTASNLAVSMSQYDKKVLLIDCDLRKPTIHKKFNISNTNGLSNFLVGEVGFDEAAFTYNDNLTILSSGNIPPNPSEMIASKKMKNFIAVLKQRFDFIIIDAPPVIAVTDAQILSTITDGVILVTAYGQAEKEAVKKAKELLDKVKANIIGAVMTKVEMNRGKGYGYYYYYGDEENVTKKRSKKAI